MINYIPPLYEDELIYSWLSRTYAHSGYNHYTYFAKEVFEVPTVRPDFEFINHYKPELLSFLTKDKTLFDIICRHTMFPYYARFMSKDRRIEAYEALSAFDSKTFYQRITMPKSKTCEVRYLRYCPLCVGEDREQYGETYWHRVHQIRHINICPKHLCYLKNSTVQITSTSSPCLLTAEESITDMEVDYCNNSNECNLAEYVEEVFKAPLDLDLDIDMGRFLTSRLVGTPYLSQRGQIRYMDKLHTDFSTFYNGTNTNGFNERWQLDKLFSSDKYNHFGVYLMAMFLGISSEDVIFHNIVYIDCKKAFDEEVFRLHSKGLNYAAIARRMGASYNVVKPIGEGLYGKYHYCTDNPRKGGSKKRDWKSLDIELLPKVKALVEQMTSIKDKRPSMVTLGRIERLLGLRDKSMDNLPTCREYILKHTISQEQFWALTLDWAVALLQKEGKPMHTTNLQRLTNMRKSYIVSALPYLSGQTSEVIHSLIQDS